jgi:hypothetical protein
LGFPIFIIALDAITKATQNLHLVPLGKLLAEMKEVEASTAGAPAAALAALLQFEHLTEPIAEPTEIDLNASDSILSLPGSLECFTFLGVR